MELADNPVVFVGVAKDKFFAWAAADAVISNTKTAQKKPVNAATAQKCIFLYAAPNATTAPLALIAAEPDEYSYFFFSLGEIISPTPPIRKTVIDNVYNDFVLSYNLRVVIKSFEREDRERSFTL